ncbi:MAG: hypothetical protein AAGA67_12070, partial [Cyanobacteria bacterium P01_F01_bin.153]
MKKVGIVAIFVVGALSGVIASYVFRSLPSNSEGAATQAEASPVSAPEPVMVSALGRLEPQDKVLNLAPPSTAAAAQARVEMLRVKEGDWVTPNQIIAVLDSYDDRQAALAEAQSRVTN